MVAQHFAALAGLKRVFHNLGAYGNSCVKIPVFTGMTGFGAVLRVDGMFHVVNRRAIYGSSLLGRLLKHPLETRHYGMRGSDGST